MRILDTLAWLACCVYATIPSFWLIVHPRADAWRERHRLRKPVYKILLPAWIGMWIAMGAITFRWRHVVLYRSAWDWIPAAVFFACGIYLYSRAGRGFLPQQLSGHHELQPEQHEQNLVVDGIRRRVRHPIYLGHFCEMLGWSIGTGLAVCWGMTAFAVATGAIMIRLEERELESRFGEAYRSYKNAVPALLPRWR